MTWKHVGSGDKNIYTSLSADVKPVTGVTAGDVAFETDTGDRFEFDGSAWQGDKFDGAQAIYGLARNPVILAAGVYDANEVKGLMILVPGSADWSITGVEGSAQTIPIAAVTAGDEWGFHLSSITVGTGGQALAYI